MTIMIFLVLGGLVSAGAVALMSVLDRSVHSVSDLERLGAPALAVVPRARRSAVELPKQKKKPVVKAVPKSPELRSA